MAGVCVVVGVGPGIGLAVARRFGREGYRLALLARRRGVLEGHAAALRDVGLDALAFAADSGKPAELRSVLDVVTEELGAPDVLVYNTAVMREAMPAELQLEDLMRDLGINVGGALIAVQHVVPAMRAAGGGTILLTGGGLALEPWPQFASLAVGKAGLRSLAFSLAKELEPDGIHVATVTITGIVTAGTHFDPDLIAETYWALHTEDRGDWRREVVYR
jgi:NAD(P)-dependent dehydrogenase (short-subunit alcohol dehydrogenase family)